MSYASHRKRHMKRLKRRYKRLAAAILGAAVLSSAMLPGMAAPTVHAAANPDANKVPVPAAQQINKIAKRVKLKTGAQANLAAPQIEQVAQTNAAQNAKAPTDSQQQTPVPDGSQQQASTPGGVQQQAPGAADQTNPAPPDRGDGGQSKAPAAKDESQQGAPAPSKYEKVLDITATAYAPGARDNDQWGNKTFLGTPIRPGVVAVDPDVIPLGSQLYIQYPDGHGEYAVAEDTGGAIKGHRIDIAMENDKQAENFGIKDVKVFVISSPSKTDSGQQDQAGQKV